MITQRKFNRLIKIFKVYLNSKERYPVFPKKVISGFKEAGVWILWKKLVNKEPNRDVMAIRIRELPNFIKECHKSHLIGKYHE